jgi:hypothetical protein
MAALLVVVTLGAAAVVIALGAVRLGVSELDLGYLAQRSGAVLAVADGCLDEVLRRLRFDPNYGVGAGSFSVPVDDGSCTMTVVDLGAGRRQLTAVGAAGSYRRKVAVEVNLSGPAFVVERWEERTD